MHSRKHREEQAQTLQQHAARIAFPDWTPQHSDWTHLYTGFHDGKPYTEVAVYRPSNDGGHERIHNRRYAGDDLTAFWVQLAREISHNTQM
ncbi:hypothetical protein [Nonomuraea sp. NPDC049400]|uniref:hypothetical protein n=1 Tax=Nonomuraea sp. NPDC049400 TaxID=3364352 RepID=UPI00378B38D8